MHANSLKIMSRLLDKYAPPSGLCVDVGSQDVNGTYRPLVEGRGLSYLGVDICPGKNVDKVLVEPKDYGMTLGEWILTVQREADLVISGQCLEHTREPWVWIQHVIGLARKVSTVILIAPSAWPQHRYPLDCWRILPDGMRSLMEWAGLEVLEVGMDDPTGRRTHVDCWGVGRLK